MTRLLIKYLPLILLFYHPKNVSGKSYFEEPVMEEIVENPFQTGIYSDNTYGSFYVSPVSPVSAYNLGISPYALPGNDDEDGFDDGGLDDPNKDYNDVNNLPVGEALLPLCLLAVVYGMRKKQQITGSD
ncbi:MAG: hypothetical protein LBR81_03025 [Prevotellaceae bacterium]|jgi:hypothetical protein|nr:hypothetical protein [Prevotellaceae bacterium]